MHLCWEITLKFDAEFKMDFERIGFTDHEP